MFNKDKFNKNVLVAKKISSKINKNVLLVFFDMMWCNLRYKAGYIDYYDMEMYNLSNNIRKTYLTHGLNLKYVRYFNNSNYYYIFLEKNIFNKTFEKYIKRDWIYLNNNLDEFKEFLINKEEIFCKPNDGFGGEGIKLIKLDSYPNKEELYNYLVNNKLLMIEEVIKNHPKLKELNPSSVNSIRLLTINVNNKCYIIKALIRMGVGSSIVDSFTGGGIFAPIDIKTGIVEDVGLNKYDDVFINHPNTNILIKGFKIPFWNEVINLVKEASSEVKEIKMVGFDVAISEDKVQLIEGNHYPGHSMYQRPTHIKNEKGLLPKIKKIKKFSKKT